MLLKAPVSHYQANRRIDFSDQGSTHVVVGLGWTQGRTETRIRDRDTGHCWFSLYQFIV